MVRERRQLEARAGQVYVSQGCSTGQLTAVSQALLLTILNRLADANETAAPRALLLALLATANRRSSMCVSDLDELARLAGIRRGKTVVRAAIKALVRAGAIAPDQVKGKAAGYRIHPLLFGNVSQGIRARLVARWEKLNRAENLLYDRRSRLRTMSPGAQENHRARTRSWTSQHRPTITEHRQLQARLAELEAQLQAQQLAELEAQVGEHQEHQAEGCPSPRPPRDELAAA